VCRSGVGRPGLEALATSGALAGLGGGTSARVVRSGAVASSDGTESVRSPVARHSGRQVQPPRRVLTVFLAPWSGRMPHSARYERDRGKCLPTCRHSDCHRVRPRCPCPGEARRSRGDPQRRAREGARGTKVFVAGVVTHRQRPATAGGTTFLNLEDETGLVNVICSPGCWTRYRKAARSAVVLLVRGRLERGEGADPEAPVVLQRGGGVLGRDRPRHDCRSFEGLPLTHGWVEARPRLRPFRTPSSFWR